MEDNKITALIITREDPLLDGCIEHLKPYVDDFVIVRHGIDYPYTEPVDMGSVRTFGLRQVKTRWFIQVDSDEYYSKESLVKIREAIDNAKDELGFRVPYYNLAWRSGYYEKKLDHFPDRVYRTDAVDKFEGILPNDMTLIKPEFYKHRPYLEYDNAEDRSFENPVQPIIQAPFYHLARTRGYNFEYTKWKKYNSNLNPTTPKEEIEYLTRINKWVTGNYEMEKIDVPKGIPTQSIVNPKVSIVIPYYNYPQYIEKCVESCLNQTVKPHEVILVNDGSPCHINSLIRKWMLQPNFIYMQQENQGESRARNNGGERATGDYLIFLDADDYIREDYIEKTLGSIGDNDVCIPDMVVFNEANYQHTYPDYSWDLLHINQIMPSTCCLFKMQAWINTKFDPNAIYCDWEMYLKMAHVGYSFTNCHEFLFFYNRKLDSNIAKLDARKEEGLDQLAKYSIRR